MINKYCGIIKICGGLIFLVFVGSQTNLHHRQKQISKELLFLLKLTTGTSMKLNPHE